AVLLRLPRDSLVRSVDARGHAQKILGQIRNRSGSLKQRGSVEINGSYPISRQVKGKLSYLLLRIWLRRDRNCNRGHHDCWLPKISMVFLTIPSTKAAPSGPVQSIDDNGQEKLCTVTLLSIQPPFGPALLLAYY